MDERIIACGIISGGANESDCTNNNDKSVAAAAAASSNRDETTEVRKILSIEPITATEVPIVTTRPEMPMAPAEVQMQLILATPMEGLMIHLV